MLVADDFFPLSNIFFLWKSHKDHTQTTYHVSDLILQEIQI